MSSREIFSEVQRPESGQKVVAVGAFQNDAVAVDEEAFAVADFDGAEAEALRVWCAG